MRVEVDSYLCTIEFPDDEITWKFSKFGLLDILEALLTEKQYKYFIEDGEDFYGNTTKARFEAAKKEYERHLRAFSRKR